MFEIFKKKCRVQVVIEEAAQLVKANSIQGNKAGTGSHAFENFEIDHKKT